MVSRKSKISVSLSNDEIKRLHRISARTNKNRSQIIEAILKEFLDNNSNGGDLFKDKISKRTINHSSANVVEQGKVLLVDSSVLNASVLSSFFVNLGHSVQILKDSPSIVDTISKSSSRFVFISFKLGKTNSFDVVKEIRRKPQNREKIIVAMDVPSDAAKREVCLKFGVNAFLSKPYSEKAVKDVIFEYKKPDEGKLSA